MNLNQVEKEEFHQVLKHLLSVLVISVIWKEF